ncbi:MAG TPA: thioredoxin [Anaerolineales bacterium]|nr:thioredoxin [Anaerolineales bacterium]
MTTVFDTALASSDLSLDRVLNAGLPVALVFYDKELPAHLRQTADSLARQYAGKVFVVTLARDDASQSITRFNVRQFPTIVTVRDGKNVSRQENAQASDLQPHLAHLVGEGPLPAPRAAASGPSMRRETSGSPLAVNEADFEREVLRSDRPVLIDFWASWCAPCRMVAPTMEKLAREQNALKVVKVDVDVNPGLASRYRAMSIPTMIVIKGGQEVDRWVGALPEQAIRSRVARWIQGATQTA